jgi:hypothetical protein
VCCIVSSFDIKDLEAHRYLEKLEDQIKDSVDAYDKQGGSQEMQ